MRNRCVLGGTVGRRSRQARIFIETFLCYMSTLHKIAGRRSRQAGILIGISISPYFHFVCMTEVSSEVLLKGVVDRLGFLLKLFLLHVYPIKDHRKA